MSAENKKIRVATCSLAGCFGCHMSFLDLDERLIDLIDVIEFDRSPFTDIKNIGSCDIGLIEGGLCNADNVDVLREFRNHCKILIAVGACAINGGVPALRNHFSVRECLEESYLDGIGIYHPKIPSDPELPLLLNKVRPIHEAVAIDFFMPGCPPPADAFYQVLTDLIHGRQPTLPTSLAHFD